MDGVDFLSELIAQNFHGDLIVGLMLFGLVYENAGRLVDGDESIILIKNIQ